MIGMNLTVLVIRRVAMSVIRVKAVAHSRYHTQAVLVATLRMTPLKINVNRIQNKRW